jgi:excisionase family DNA binding protein
VPFAVSPEVRHNHGPPEASGASWDTVRTYTISEAAELTGVSRKAIARRVERGSLRSVVRNGRRRIPRSELVRAGLLEDGAQRAPRSGPASPPLPRPGPGGELAEVERPEDMLSALFREVLDRFERQSQEIAQYRALTVQAESLRLTNELADLRVRLAELEGRPQTQDQQPGAQAAQAAGDLGRRVSELTKQVEELSKREIWLPPQAESAQQSAFPAQPPSAATRPPATPMPAARQPAPPAPPRTPRFSRTKRFVVEAAFIIAVAVIVWQAQLPVAAIAVAMALAWTLVAVVEWFSSERPDRR